MRLLCVLPYVPSPIRVRPYHFVRELSKRHEVTVLATGTSCDVEDAARLRSFCRRVEVVPLRHVDRIRSCAAAVWRGEPLQAAVCRSPGFARRLADLLAERPFDLVHVEHLRAAHVAAQVRHLPAVLDSVDCISLLQERTLQHSASTWQRVVAAMELHRTRTYEAHVLPLFDRVSVTSAVDGEALRRLAPSAQISVVANGVDLQHFQPNAGPKEPATLVFSGKMSYHANVTAVLCFVREILPLIRGERPDVRFRIVGSSPPPSVVALARDPRIEVTGYLPDIRDAIRCSTVAVCPVTVKVGIQNKVLEAMAMGLPVVCTRQGFEGLEAEAGQDLLVAGNPRAFAEHVCRLLADASLREEIGHAGRCYVEQYHRWDTAASQLEALYADAVAGRASGTTSPHGAVPWSGLEGTTALARQVQ